MTRSTSLALAAIALLGLAAAGAIHLLTRAPAGPLVVGELPPPPPSVEPPRAPPNPVLPARAPAPAGVGADVVVAPARVAEPERPAHQGAKVVQPEGTVAVFASEEDRADALAEAQRRRMEGQMDFLNRRGARLSAAAGGSPGPRP